MPDPSYGTIHKRARKIIPKSCALADESCAGPLQCALREDVSEEKIRYETNYRGQVLRYFIGDPMLGYERLCASHHTRKDGVAFDSSRAKEAAQKAVESGWFGSEAQHEHAIYSGSRTSEAKAKASRANFKLAGHVRHHVKRGIVNPECELCS